MNRRHVVQLMVGVPLLGGSALFAQKDEKRPIPEKALPYFGPRKRLAVSGIEVKVKGITMVTPLPSSPDSLTTTVFEFSAASGGIAGLDFGTGLADMLITELVRSNRFIVLEREGIAKLVEEQKTVVKPAATAAATGTQTPPPADPPPPASGIDSWDRATVVAGKLLGAQVMVFGAITELQVGKTTKKLGRGADDLNKGSDKDSSGNKIEWMGGVLGEFTSKRSYAVVAMDIKLVDVSTGQILDSVRAEGRVAADMTKVDLKGFDIRLEASKSTSSPLGAAVRGAIQDGVRKICARMEQVVWQAKIAAVETESGVPLLYLNAGKDSGLKEGDVLEVVRPGKEIKDPDTGGVIGRVPGKVVGKCRVVRVLDSKITEATPLEGTEFQAGDVVQLPAPVKES